MDKSAVTPWQVGSQDPKHSEEPKTWMISQNVQSTCYIGKQSVQQIENRGENMFFSKNGSKYSKTNVF